MQFIDLKKQYALYKDEIDRAMQDVCADAAFIFGPRIEQLEQELADYTGAENAIACANGTDALVLALMALGIGPGDEVITSPFTFFATAEAIVAVGAKPVFADIHEDTYNMDPQAALKCVTPQTKALMPVSLFGQPSDMDELQAIADEHGLHVIEDAAQSFGARYGAKKSCNLSEVATTSFFPAKPLGCYGDGGAVFCSKAQVADKLRLLRNHGQQGRYDYLQIGMNSRLDGIQAAVLSIKLKHFEKEVNLRAEVAGRYAELIEAHGPGDLVVPTVKEGRTSVFAQYCLRSSNREAVQKRLQEAGIPSAIYYPKPLHLQPALSHLGYGPGDFPLSEKVAGEIFAVPMHPFLEQADQEKVVKAMLGK